MDHLWAPWRLAYVAKDPTPKVTDECFICRGLAEADDRRNLIVLRGSLDAVLLNKFPYNNGHLLIAPRAHKGRLDELTSDEALKLHRTLTLMLGVVELVLTPADDNL